MQQGICLYELILDSGYCTSYSVCELASWFYYTFLPAVLALWSHKCVIYRNSVYFWHVCTRQLNSAQYMSFLPQMQMLNVANPFCSSTNEQLFWESTMVGRAFHIFQQLEVGRCLTTQLSCVWLAGEVVIIVNIYDACHFSSFCTEASFLEVDYRRDNLENSTKLSLLTTKLRCSGRCVPRGRVCLWLLATWQHAHHCTSNRRLRHGNLLQGNVSHHVSCPSLCLEDTL